MDSSTASGVVEWLSNDPIGISGGLNQYVFCGNSPVNFTDPFGLCKEKSDWDTIKANWAKLRESDRNYTGPLGAAPGDFTIMLDRLAAVTAGTSFDWLFKDNTPPGAVMGIVPFSRTIVPGKGYRSVRIDNTKEYGPHIHIEPNSGPLKYISFQSVDDALSKLPSGLRSVQKIVTAIVKALQ